MKRPNLIVIVNDQHRADALGFAGGLPVQTPHLDELAADGVVFDRAYTPTPLCTPARATLVTGQYPSRHGAWSIGVDLPDDAPSVAQVLGDAGYRTALIGKSHLRSCLRADSFEARPHNAEFDFFRSWSGPWYGFEHAQICTAHVWEEHAYSMHYGAWLEEMGIPCSPPFFSRREREGMPVRDDGGWDLPVEAHNSTWVADRAIDVINDAEQDGRPFYLSINFAEPHEPFNVSAPWHTMYADVDLPPARRQPGEWADKSTLFQQTLLGHVDEWGWSPHSRVPAQSARRPLTDSRSADEDRDTRIYLGMVSLIDAQIGRILAALRQAELADDTVVVFTADHGDMLGDHYLWAKGGSHYDGSVHVPFIVRWPGHAPAGVHSAALQSLVDLPPTLLAAAGIEPPAWMQGIDQTPTWGHPEMASRDAVWIDHRVEAGVYVNTWITPSRRLSVYGMHAESKDEIELFDLDTDPHEYTNVATDRPAEVIALLTEMLRYRSEKSLPWSERFTFA